MRFRASSRLIFLFFCLMLNQPAHADLAAADKTTATAQVAQSVPAVQTVILISIDGLGRDQLSAAETPHLWRLAQGGGIARRAESVLPPKTIPGHVSMLSGVRPERHARIENELGPLLEPVKVPTLFHLSRLNGARSVAIVGKEKLRHVLSRAPIDRMVRPQLFPFGEFWGRLPFSIESAFEKELSERPAFLFVHYAFPDTVGHWFGWGGWAQRWVIRWVDASIGRLVSEVEKRWRVGSYAIIATADHGGHDGAHGRQGPEGEYDSRDISIPWILYGAHFRPGVTQVYLEDTAPSVAALLGWRVPMTWAWSGRSVVRFAAKPSANPSAKPMVQSVNESNSGRMSEL